MPKISLYTTGPEVGNKLGVKSITQAQKDLTDQLNLSATINRINNVRAQYDKVPEEGLRVTSNVKERGETLASSGAERAEQLKSLVDKSINRVQNNSSKTVAGKTALVQARNQPMESGKGVKLDFEA